jgi:hypothetical protein
MTSAAQFREGVQGMKDVQAAGGSASDAVDALLKKLGR